MITEERFSVDTYIKFLQKTLRGAPTPRLRGLGAWCIAQGDEHHWHLWHATLPTLPYTNGVILIPIENAPTDMEIQSIAACMLQVDALLDMADRCFRGDIPECSEVMRMWTLREQADRRALTETPSF